MATSPVFGELGAMPGSARWDQDPPEDSRESTVDLPRLTNYPESPESAPLRESAAPYRAAPRRPPRRRPPAGRASPPARNGTMGRNGVLADRPAPAGTLPPRAV